MKTEDDKFKIIEGALYFIGTMSAFIFIMLGCILGVMIGLR
jgi:hypothetical protein